MHFTKIPSDKSILKELNKREDLKVEIKNGDVLRISSEDSIEEMLAQKCIRANSLGFSVNKSLEIIEGNKDLREIDIKKYVPNDKRAKEQKGRLIGKNGKTKRIIKELTETDLKIKKLTVGVIGDIDDVMFTLRIIKSLIKGASHSTIYSKMEKYRSNKFSNRIEYKK